jgi:hypothetical protein
MSFTITTPIPSGVDTSNVVATLHNHETMIAALCPGLISHEFISGDKATESIYSVTDKKPIGQVSPPTLSSASGLFETCRNEFRQHTNSPSPTCPTASTPSSTQNRPSAR